MSAGPRVTVGNRTYTERKVMLAWTDRHGKPRARFGWLSQVQTLTDRHAAMGATDFRFRLHTGAPWHAVTPTPEETPDA